MTNKEVINFLNQVRKILLDDKSWLESTIQPINEAFDMAINALTAQPETPDKRTEMHACDLIDRQALMKEFSDFVRASNNSDFAPTPTWNDAVSLVGSMPPAQQELTDVQAIEHLRESGWMQNHDKQMYEMGLREQLADDSDSYDALLPSAQPESASGFLSRNMSR